MTNDFQVPQKSFADYVSEARKFIVAGVGFAVTLSLLDAGTAQQIGAVVTSLATYLVPNA